MNTKSKLLKKLCWILAALLIICFKCFVLNNMVVNGNSMASTYQNGDAILIDKLSAKSSINRFDVVIIHAKRDGFNTDIIKRVIGLPNETIQIIHGYVYINGSLLNSDVYGEPMINGGIAVQPVILKNNEYFVLGDNRNASSDSRDKWLQKVKSNQIIGKPLYRVFPFTRIGKLKN